MTRRPRILGQLLVQSGWVSAEAVDAALAEQRAARERIGETLVRHGATTSEQVARGLAIQLGLEYREPPLAADNQALRVVRPELARAHRVVPLAVDTRSLAVAMADPLDLEAVDDLRFQTSRRVEPCVASPEAVEEALERCYGEDLETLLEALPSDLRGEDRRASEELERATRAAPVVRLVDRLLAQAIDQEASDIHVEETGADVRVRYRIDGVLRQAVDLPAAVRRAVLSRIKVIAGMDISVRRRAQDGRIPFAHGDRTLTLRVSTMPVNGGEKAVVRILLPRAKTEPPRMQ